MQRGIGDALLTFENEVELIRQEYGQGDFEVIYPSSSILAENPVSVVDTVVDRRGTRPVAQAYLEYLYSDVGQELAVKHHFRPRSETVASRHVADFKKIKLFTVDELFGGWRNAQKVHFAEGGVFDSFYAH